MHLNFPNLDSCYTGVNMGLSNGSIPSVVACGVHCVPEFLHISVDKAIMNTIVDRMGYTDRRMPLLESLSMDSLSGWGPIRSIQKMVIKNRREKDELL